MARTADKLAGAVMFTSWLLSTAAGVGAAVVTWRWLGPSSWVFGDGLVWAGFKVLMALIAFGSVMRLATLALVGALVTLGAAVERSGR